MKRIEWLLSTEILTPLLLVAVGAVFLLSPDAWTLGGLVAALVAYGHRRHLARSVGLEARVKELEGKVSRLLNRG